MIKLMLPLYHLKSMKSYSRVAKKCSPNQPAWIWILLECGLLATWTWTSYFYLFSKSQFSHLEKKGGELIAATLRVMLRIKRTDVKPEGKSPCTINAFDTVTADPTPPRPLSSRTLESTNSWACPFIVDCFSPSHRAFSRHSTLLLVFLRSCYTLGSQLSCSCRAGGGGLHLPTVPIFHSPNSAEQLRPFPNFKLMNPSAMVSPRATFQGYLITTQYL